MDKARPKTADAKSSANDAAKSTYTRASSSSNIPASKINAATRTVRDIEATVDHAKETTSKTVPEIPAHVPIPTTSNYPRIPRNDPVVSPSNTGNDPTQPPKKPWWTFFYDKEKKTYCGRTCVDWGLIIIYTIMYMIFLSTYTMIFLYASLRLVKLSENYMISGKAGMYTFQDNGIGLTATPTSEHSYPLIWFKSGDKKDYQQYVNSLDSLLGKNRRKREVSQLGPCGTSPYGYGDSPCVVVRVNKQIAWAGKPVLPGSELAKSAPPEVQKLLKLDKQKLWFHCDGYYPWDQEHIGEIKYYPDPPGIDPDLFPMNMSSSPPMLALQITKFTLGISLAVECKLWYDEGPSSFHFVLYVEPKQARKNFNADLT